MIGITLFYQGITKGPGLRSYSDHTIEILLMLLGAWLLGWLFWHFFVGVKKNKRIIKKLSNLNSKIVKSIIFIFFSIFG